MSLVPFEFDQFTVRTLSVDGVVSFVAADVCGALELANVSKALEALDSDEKGITQVDTLGGPQKMLTVTESGLYHLIFVSRKAEAQRFRKWVTSELLPAVRKTGSYTPLAPFDFPARLAAMEAEFAQTVLDQRTEWLRIGLPFDLAMRHGQEFLPAARKLGRLRLKQEQEMYNLAQRQALKEQHMLQTFEAKERHLLNLQRLMVS